MRPIFQPGLVVIIALFAGMNLCASTRDPHPIVEVQTGFLLGGSADGQWIEASRVAKMLRPQTTFHVYDLTSQIGQITGGRAKSVDEPCPDTLGLTLSKIPEKGVIALDGSWNAMPRKVRSADTTQPVYIDAVREFLKGHGIADPKVKITRIVRADLDGDNEDEVLISASSYTGSNEEGTPRSSAGAGDYSCVLLRHVVAGKVQTELVAGEFYAKETGFSAPNNYEISAVLDLNGDGKLEIVIQSTYYEGGRDDHLRMERRKAQKRPVGRVRRLTATKPT